MRIHDVGVVGAGTIARQMHLPVLTSMPGVRVAWVADVDPTVARVVARSFGVPALDRSATPADLPPCDVALLAVPVAFRDAYLEALAVRGVAVFAEKPFATTTADHERWCARFEEHRLGCGYMRRGYGATAAALRALRGGWFGAPRCVRIAEGGRTERTGADHVHFDTASGGPSGVLLDLGSHELDRVLGLLEAKRYRVSRCEIVLDGTVDRRAAGNIDLWSDGRETPVDVEFVFSWLDPQPNRTVIEFDRATIAWGNRPGDPVTVLGADGTVSWTVERGPGAAGTPNQAFFAEWRAFLDGLESGRASQYSARSALATTALVEDLYRVGMAR